jgi:hypothetical protein
LYQEKVCDQFFPELHVFISSRLQASHPRRQNSSTVTAIRTSHLTRASYDINYYEVELGWAGHAQTTHVRKEYTILAAILKGRGSFHDLGTDGRIILKRILNTQCGRVGIGFSEFKIETSDKTL